MRLTPGGLWLNLHQKFGHGLAVAWYRDVVRPRILSTSPRSPRIQLLIDETDPWRAVVESASEVWSRPGGRLVPGRSAAAHSVDLADRRHDRPALRNPRPYLRTGLAQSHLDTEIVLCRKRSAVRAVHPRGWFARG